MTKPLIEQLIKAYEEYTALLGKSEGDLAVFAYAHGTTVPDEFVLQGKLLREHITALTKDYRERRRFVNVYEFKNPDGTTDRGISDEDWDSYGDAYDWRDKLDTYKETVEIIRNKP